MVLAIDLPHKDAKVIVKNGRIYVIFDENKSRMDLWKASFYLWLTNGDSITNFMDNDLLTGKRLEISKTNKLNLRSQ